MIVVPMMMVALPLMILGMVMAVVLAPVALVFAMVAGLAGCGAVAKSALLAPFAGALRVLQDDEPKPRLVPRTA